MAWPAHMDQIQKSPIQKETKAARIEKKTKGTFIARKIQEQKKEKIGSLCYRSAFTRTIVTSEMFPVHQFAALFSTL